jgi:phosphoribosylamine--glycine ligase
VRVLVLGSGGREHALVWRLRRDPVVSEVIAAPGNPGIRELARIASVDLDRPDEVLRLAGNEKIDLTVVGPEAPLARGLADLFRQHGRLIVGPSQAGAALEASKVVSKRFMEAHGIPTARFVAADSLEGALAALDQFNARVVVKADGLAAGKGVVVAETRAEATAAIRAAMVDKAFGDSGDQVVIEECLAGPEVSVFYLCDGTRAVALGTAQDHKRIFDEDKGPNTGGMGAFAPSPLADLALMDFTARRVVEPLLAGMRAQGSPYSGFLYVSLMLTDDGPQVIEFNVRFGDPEAQVVLPLIQGSFAEALAAAASGDVSRARLSLSSDRAVGVVLASRGYPSSAETGTAIHGLDEAASTDDALVFHAGTREEKGRVVTAGGRVLTVVGCAETFSQAMASAYSALRLIQLDGMLFRHVLGVKAIAATGEVLR